MAKKTIYHIIEWVVAVAACGYLVWRLATYDDYASLWATLRAMGWREGLALGLCVALMPVNMAIEAWRWYSLMNEGMKELTNERITFQEAQRQVYYSKLAGLITPWRLGEYPARAVLISGQQSVVSGQQSVVSDQQAVVSDQRAVWARVLSMGAVGSATMTAAIVIAGMISLGVLGILGGLGNLETLSTGSYLAVIGGVLVGTVVLAVVGWFVGSRTLASTVVQPSFDRRSTVVILMKSLGQSFVRLLCWCVQLGLVLYALGAVSGQWSAVSDQQSVISGQWSAVSGQWVVGGLARSAVYYLLVTVTPNVPIAEAGVRGVWAITVFGSMNAALAGVLLWVINTLMPCLVWPFIRKNNNI